MKPIEVAGIVVALIAVFLLGVSVAEDSSPPAQASIAPAPENVALNPGAVEPAETPREPPAAPAPQVIHVEVPPQIIYVQVPAAPVSETLASTAAASAAASCHASYSGVCLDPRALDYDCTADGGDGPSFTPGPFVVVGPDFFLLDPDRDGIACETAATPVVRASAQASVATQVPSVVAPPPAAPPQVAPVSTVAPATSSGTSSRSGISPPKPTATPVLTRGTVVVNFAGAPAQKPTVALTFGVQPGQNAWTAIRQAIGQSNLTFQDFGGSLGIFITGFYGVQAEGNHFWEFFVNGQSSSAGVSAYIVKGGDVLEFRYSSF